MFNNDTTVLHVKVLKNKGSAPTKVLKGLEIYLNTINNNEPQSSKHYKNRQAYCFFMP
ncbi:MAG: hypothetical protein U9N32_02780 [Spirochaetota bacterium]|nr:hypothetical protein [Spirochaetota bacterium]